MKYNKDKLIVTPIDNKDIGGRIKRFENLDELVYYYSIDYKLYSDESGQLALVHDFVFTPIEDRAAAILKSIDLQYALYYAVCLERNTEGNSGPIFLGYYRFSSTKQLYDKVTLMLNFFSEVHLSRNGDVAGMSVKVASGGCTELFTSLVPQLSRYIGSLLSKVSPAAADDNAAFYDVKAVNVDVPSIEKDEFIRYINRRIADSGMDFMVVCPGCSLDDRFIVEIIKQFDTIVYYNTDRGYLNAIILSSKRKG